MNLYCQLTSNWEEKSKLPIYISKRLWKVYVWVELKIALHSNKLVTQLKTSLYVCWFLALKPIFWPVFYPLLSGYSSTLLYIYTILKIGLKNGFCLCEEFVRIWCSATTNYLWARPWNRDWGSFHCLISYVYWGRVGICLLFSTDIDISAASC